MTSFSNSDQSAAVSPDGIGVDNGDDEAEQLSQNMSQMSMSEEKKAEERKKRVYVWISGMGQEECKFIFKKI